MINDDNRFFYKNPLKNMLCYDEITKHKRTENDPPTYEEYMKGDNRYHYFDLMTYVAIICELGNVDKEEIIFACNLRLLVNIYRRNITWEEFHECYDISKFVESMTKSIQTLPEQERAIIIANYGLKDGQYMTYNELSNVFGIPARRIHYIVEHRIMRKLIRLSRLGELKSEH